MYFITPLTPAATDIVEALVTSWYDVILEELVTS